MLVNISVLIYISISVHRYISKFLYIRILLYVNILYLIWPDFGSLFSVKHLTILKISPWPTYSKLATCQTKRRVWQQSESDLVVLSVFVNSFRGSH